MQPDRTSPRQALLGVFILFQIGFLVVANLLGFMRWVPAELNEKQRALLRQAAPGFQDEGTHGHQWAERVDTAVNRLAQLTGQEQNWMLYTPVSKATGFPAVVLVWDDEEIDDSVVLPGTMFAFDKKNGCNLCATWNTGGREPTVKTMGHLGMLAAGSPWEAVHLAALANLREEDQATRIEMVLSDNEPKDLRFFVRFGHCRLRRYEGQFYMNLQPEDHDEPEAAAERMSRRTRKFVSEWHDHALHYLKWHLARWEKAHPDRRRPDQVLLVERFYRILPPPVKPDDPPRGWDGPVLYPIARWRPGRIDDGFHRLEPFDFTERRFFMSR